METEKLAAITADILNVPRESINENTAFVADLGADSLDIAQIMMAVEDEFGVEFDLEQLEGIVTVADAVERLKTARKV